MLKNKAAFILTIASLSLITLFIPLCTLLYFTISFLSKRKTVNIIFSVITSVTVLAAPHNIDTENYRVIYDYLRLDYSWMNDFNNGIELGYLFSNLIPAKLGLSFDMYLVLYQSILNISLVLLLRSLNVKTTSYFLLYLFIISPVYVLNTTLLIRTFLSFSIFILFYINRKKTTFNLFGILIASTIHSYLAIIFPCYVDKIRNLINNRITICLIVCVYLYQFYFGSIAKDIISLVSSVYFTNAFLARKIVFLNEIANISNPVALKNMLLILLSVFIASPFIKNTPIKINILISIFSLTSILALLFPYGEIIITRIGFFPYFLFPIYAIIYSTYIASYSKGTKLISNILMAYSILTIIYSFAYNDLFNSTSRVMANGKYLTIGFFQLFGFNL